VAYLRDVTHLPGLARQALANEQAQETMIASTPADSGVGGNGGAVSDVPPVQPSDRTKSKADASVGSMKRNTLKVDGGLNLGGSSKPAGGTGSEDSASPPADDQGTETAGDGSGGGSPPPTSKDRRIGRWRGRKE